MAAHLPDRPANTPYVFAVGKAAGPMAEEVEALWGDDIRGLVVARFAFAAHLPLAVPIAPGRKARPPAGRRRPPRWHSGSSPHAPGDGDRRGHLLLFALGI